MANYHNNLNPLPQIVVVNDDLTQLNVQCGLLRKASLAPVTFKGAENALAAMRPDSPPALIITDLYMPGIDGWRFCRLLRSPEYLPYNHIPVLVTSAIFSGDETSQITIDLGADAFLPLPVDGPRFIKQVQDLLQGDKSQLALKVLIVEDSKLVSYRLTQAFQARGYQVDAAANFNEGLTRIEHTSYDIAALDYHLPDGLGDGLLKALHEKNPECVCIMMTTDARPELALAWMKMGAASYIHKPFETEFFMVQCERAARERTLLHVQDLAEQRTVQLREKEAKYRLLFESMQEGFALHEIIQDASGKVVDYRFLDVNEAYEVQTGWKREDVVGKTLLEIFPQTSLQRIEAYGRVALTGEPLKFEYYSKTYQRYLRVKAFCPQRGRFATLVEDISGRKQSEEQLRILSQAVEQNSTSIVITDTRGAIEYVNPRFTQLTGYTLDDVLGVNPRILKSGKNPAQLYADLWNRITCGREWRGVFCNKKKSGELYWESASISPIMDELGKITHFVAVKEDVTERRQMVDDLVKSEHRMSALLSAVPDLIFRLSRDGVFLDYKAGFDDRLAVNQGQIVGMPLNRVLDYASAEKAMACIEQALQSKKVQTMEYTHKKGDARHRYEARFKDSGKDEVTAIVRDISERARLEQMKSDLINRITHELSTPLTIIELMVNLMEGNPTPEEYKEYWDVLKDEVSRERLLSEHLLSASRLENNQISLHFSSCDLVEFINHAAHQIELPATDKKITVLLQTLIDPEGLPALIDADEKALTQVLMNLFENAIKFTPSGGMIKIILQRTDSGFEISIIDTGIGIPDEDLPLLFTRFFRGSNAIDNEIQGTGIGLFIVRSILEKHGGKISAHSELGKGSQFDIWLPEITVEPSVPDS